MVANDLLHPGQSRCNLSAHGPPPDSESDSGCGLPWAVPRGFRVTFAESARVSDRLLALTAGRSGGGINEKNCFEFVSFLAEFIASGSSRSVTDVTDRYDSEESDAEEESER